jgi:hypothetical protein
MAGGDCVKATFMEYLNVHGKKKDQYKYVVVLRQTFGIENYNFHCLLKKTNPADGKVYMIDASNSAKMVNDGEKLVMTWDEWVERDKPLLDGKYTYFEWTWEEVLNIFLDEESDDFQDSSMIAKDRWDLKPKEFNKLFSEFKSYQDYMQNYFLPVHQPKMFELYKEADKLKEEKVS